MPGVGVGLVDTAGRPLGGGAAPYVEVGYLGEQGTSALYSMSSNEMGGIPVVVPDGGVWAKTIHYLMHQANAGSKLRPLVMNGTGIASDTLFYLAPEYTYPATISVDTEVVVSLMADGSAKFFPAGNYIIGYKTDIAQTVRGNSVVPPPTFWKGDPYASPGATWGDAGATPSQSAARMSVWLPYSLNSGS